MDDLECLTYRFTISLSTCECRLINRGLYPLAVEICSYLKLPPEEGEVKVLRQWALRKVHNVRYQDPLMDLTVCVQCTYIIYVHTFIHLYM